MFKNTRMRRLLFKAVSIDNIYRLDGRVPIAKAIPFGLQHVLAMFVSNLAPIPIIAAAAMILAGLIPPIGNFFASLPQAVLGGCTIMMFGQILLSAMQMIAACGFSQRNITIASLSLAVGVGFTAASEQDIWAIFPKIVQDVFSGNVVAVVFVVAIILSYALPENMEVTH